MGICKSLAYQESINIYKPIITFVIKENPSKKSVESMW